MKTLSPEIGDAVRILCRVIREGQERVHRDSKSPPFAERDAEVLRHLGEVLLAMTAGAGTWVEDRTPGARTDASSADSLSVAYLYHLARIEHPGSGDEDALAEVRAIRGPTLSDATIRKYAQRHRDQVLLMLEHARTPVEIEPWIEANLRARGDSELNRKLDLAALVRDLADCVARDGAPKVSAYREYLRKKSPRADVE